ncbi:MAG TPA: D-Ala-D-Ala carboxypeptidase family metallohydrolase [Rhabdochlamydiaceae bacterium]|nr:D-Ala-D-Ala carboxypeptidase family metallohydrolase [Rhabdochlamydiaceae bacterium]
MYITVLYPVFLGILIFLTGCSGLEQSEQEKIRRMNAKGEFVYRTHDEYLYAIGTPKHRLREKYPWEETLIGNHSKITKEFFRCRGSSLNPAHVNHADPANGVNFDCGGIDKHSLPLRENKEFVYPILIELLNYIQAKMGKKVVITCGHRCPQHNVYADPSPFNQSSKHMIGAEVDFYVQGMEQKPEDIVNLLMQFYRETPGYRDHKDYEDFKRYEKGDTNVSTHPWYNKEIFIKLFKKHEGRDSDNRHPYPYLCIQVRHDRDLNEKVTYTWQKAFNEFRRY